MSITIYRASTLDHRHPHYGVYVDIAASFELPVGPFPSVAVALQFISDNSARIIELYGSAEIARVAS